MTLALYIIASTAVLLWLSAKLTEAHEEIARLRGGHDNRAQDDAAYARGVTMSLACLLVCLAAASRYAPRKGTGE
jgi:ABC-type Fe3+ transport system permease subunit